METNQHHLYSSSGSCGQHVVIPVSNSYLLLFGSNQYGQLSLSDLCFQSTPQFMKTEIQFVDAACGHYHTLLLAEDGSLWVMGDNNKGQLGLSHEHEQTTMVRVDDMGFDNAMISCGMNHSMVLKNDGSLWGCGYNFFHQVDSFSNQNQKTFKCLMKDIQKVSCGAYQTLALTNQGKVVCWGSNNDEKQLSSALDIGGGRDYSVVKTTDGKLHFSGIFFMDQLESSSSFFCGYDYIIVKYSGGTCIYYDSNGDKVRKFVSANKIFCFKHYVIYQLKDGRTFLNSTPCCDIDSSINGLEIHFP